MDDSMIIKIVMGIVLLIVLYMWIWDDMVRSDDNSDLGVLLDKESDSEMENDDKE